MNDHVLEIFSDLLEFGGLINQFTYRSVHKYINTLIRCQYILMNVCLLPEVCEVQDQGLALFLYVRVCVCPFVSSRQCMCVDVSCVGCNDWMTGTHMDQHTHAFREKCLDLLPQCIHTPFTSWEKKKSKWSVMTCITPPHPTSPILKAERHCESSLLLFVLM